MHLTRSAYGQLQAFSARPGLIGNARNGSKSPVRKPPANARYLRNPPVHGTSLERQQRVCAVKGGAFQWVQIPPGETLQPEATGAVMEVTKWLKPSV